ncbi:histone-like nucleoid-structuring protein Lsr2 [Nocardia sp. NPDC049220]
MSRRRSTTTKSGNRVQTGEIREWARNNGRTVSSRGRVPEDIVAAYRAAH